MKARAPSGTTVLVVDDDEVVREGFAAALRHEGYTVVTAGDGHEAFGVLSAGLAPSLILLNMVMPGGDGWSFLSRRAQSPGLASIPVLIVTALGTATRDWAHSLGAAGFLQKPVTPEVLAQEVRRYAGQGPP